MTEQQAATVPGGTLPGGGGGTGPEDLAAAERTLGQLVSDATRDLSEIVRAEIALAGAELRKDATNGAVAGGLFGAAGYLGLLSSITAVIAAGYGLAAAGLRPWAAFLVVTAALLLIAGLLVLIGRSRIRRLGPPERAIRSTRRTIEAVRPGSRTR